MDFPVRSSKLAQRDNTMVGTDGLNPTFEEFILRLLFFSAFILLSLADLAGHALCDDRSNRPNVVLIYADDLGFGDLGCYGQTKWRTPHIDSLAKEGIRFTNFLVSQPVCSASRASLLTGCYANRIGIRGALSPDAKVGIHERETTLAEMLKSKGYATSMVGKWHLGHHARFLPTHHGFDSYLGLPYSNDMWPHGKNGKRASYPTLPLFDDDKVIDVDVDGADQAELTRRYQQRAVEFIRKNQASPFFLYFAHTFPHVPLYVGASQQNSVPEVGTYGAVIQEFDQAVGAILQELESIGQAENTLVIFSSDNGPWLVYGDHAGSAGGLREGKGTVFEGGIRVPFIVRWPKEVGKGLVQDEVAMTIDLFPTIASIVGAPLPELKIDGHDMQALWKGGKRSEAEQPVYFHYYHDNELQAVRWGHWKLMLPQTYNSIAAGTPGSGGLPGKYVPLKIESPQLFDLSADPSEQHDLAAERPAQLAEMLKFADGAREDLGDSITKSPGKNRREPGKL
jgi:arylsulfatase A